jgi:hypothetical protein
MPDTWSGVDPPNGGPGAATISSLFLDQNVAYVWDKNVLEVRDRSDTLILSVMFLDRPSLEGLIRTLSRALPGDEPG